MTRIERAMDRFERFVFKWARKAYIWSLLKQLPKRPAPEVLRLVERELDAIPESILGHFDWQRREVEILSDRLARRFDVAMALNEATNRAIEEKGALRISLGSGQLAAFEHQKVVQMGNIRRA
jgi:hypothetical protein